MKAFKLIGALILMLFLTTAPANAFLLGETLLIEYLYPDSSTVYDSTTATVVDPGIEWEFRIGTTDYGVDIDIKDDLITISNNTRGWASSSGFNGFVFTDPFDTIPDFGSFYLISTSGFVPPIAPILSSTANTLSANFNATVSSNVADDFGSVYTFGVAPIPEPTTMLLLGVGLIGLVGVTRKKLKK